MNTILFEVEETYRLTKANEDQVMERLQKLLSQTLSQNITWIEGIGVGQNNNFKVYTKNSEIPCYLLKVISKKGYPSVKTLETTYKHLRSAGITCPEIVYYELSSAIVPYGYLLQTWIAGEQYNTQEGMSWIEAFASILKKVHSVSLPYFGYIDEGPNYPTLKAYFYHMDTIIDHSFGQVFKKPYSIWDLEKHGFTTLGFLERTFNKVKGLADQIKATPRAVLLHGDMFAHNLLLSDTGVELIDWDEARAGWWVYDLARTLYYNKDQQLFNTLLTFYKDESTSIEDVCIGIRLEHIRQLLRQLFMQAFNTGDIAGKRENIKGIEEAIDAKFEEDLFD